MKRLLCVFAHPDDESYGPGGTIARCVLDGVDVFITMFTAGEAGSIGVSKTLARDELARRRRLEMAAASTALGVGGYRMLGAPDGGLARIDAGWAIGEIRADLERFRPQVVLTFHRGGVSGHPDHIAVTGFLDRALAAAGPNGPQACYQWGIPRHVAPFYQRPGLVPLEDHEVAAVVNVSDAAMDRKIEAIRCHETQYDMFVGLQQKMDYRTVTRPEYFARGRSRVAPRESPVGDLFAGIEAD